MMLPAQHPIREYPSQRPLLKWAGGKTQLLFEIIKRMPASYGRFIEPFLGGGALFFAVAPTNGIIADSNPELMNVYSSVALDVEGVIEHLRSYKNTEEDFYKVRAQGWKDLSKTEAAARTIFLNKTCFNGLYRVNKKGHFNVPYGHYKNPKILDEFTLRQAADLLKRSTILCTDYKDVLKLHAKPGDFIFLDPPYIPISKYSDFKRYTKDQFREEDHIELASEYARLHEMGCHVLLTNSNHPLVHDYYKKYTIEIIQTKRHISCNGNGRNGEDVIVTAPLKQTFCKNFLPTPIPKQTEKYPSTRFMGSKNKILMDIWGVASQFKYDAAIDLFSGSGIVSYMFKSYGKSVISNDYMAMSSTLAKATIENNSITLSKEAAEALLEPRSQVDHFVEDTFKGLYFSDDENRFIDVLRANIKTLENPYEQAIAMSALIRACMKKRPRGIFTYIGNRYDDGRKDLLKSLKDHFLEAVDLVNSAVFDNGKKNLARCGDAMTLEYPGPSLVYIDPPYYSPLSDNEYVRRYHFVEGLARGWHGVEIQKHTLTKKFKSYPTPFSSRAGAAEAFDRLFGRFGESILVVSYSSNSLPTLEEMIAILSKHKNKVEVIPVEHKYSFGNQGHKVGNNKNDVKEYIFVGY